jgi:hypothetical protein
LFAAFLLYSAITILTKGGKVKPLEDESAMIVDETVIPPYEVKRYPLGLAASLVAGALSGLLGIGGGPIKVPVMYIFMNVPLMVATATSNFMIGVTAAASAIVYYRRGDILARRWRPCPCPPGRVTPTWPASSASWLNCEASSSGGAWCPNRSRPSPTGGPGEPTRPMASRSACSLSVP